MRAIDVTRAAMWLKTTSLVVHMGSHAILIGRNQCEKTGLESMSEEHHVKQLRKNKPVTSSYDVAVNPSTVIGRILARYVT